MYRGFMDGDNTKIVRKRMLQGCRKVISPEIYITSADSLLPNIPVSGISNPFHIFSQ